MHELGVYPTPMHFKSNAHNAHKTTLFCECVILREFMNIHLVNYIVSESVDSVHACNKRDGQLGISYFTCSLYNYNCKYL